MSQTPMMQQYEEMKAQHPEALLMFRLGDFFELFFDDALDASALLGITLTGRDAGNAGRIPMCGVPAHAVEQYIARLIDHGRSVALCDQVEDAKLAKGLVRREVVRIITPGTAMHEEGQQRRWLAAVTMNKGEFGLSIADVATGDVWYAAAKDPQSLVDILWQRAAAEILVPKNIADRWRQDELTPTGVAAQLPAWQWLFDFITRSGAVVTASRRDGATAHKLLCDQYGVTSMTPLDLADSPASVDAIAMLLGFVRDTQKVLAGHMKPPRCLLDRGWLTIDYTARHNLELFETQRNRQQNGSLFGLLNRTRTLPGGRLLREWVERPLCCVQPIHDRLDAVECLLQDMILREHLRRALANVCDLDRLAGRVAFGSMTPRDIVSLARTLTVVPDVQGPLSVLDAGLLRAVSAEFPDLSRLASMLIKFVVDDPPSSIRDGGFIRDGVDASLDSARQVNRSGKQWLAELEASERSRTGIKTLKVGFNKVFGYYIEVSKSQTGFVPPDYERKQTLATGERYTMPGLKEREHLILDAEQSAAEREYQLFCDLRDQVAAELTHIRQTSSALAQIDALVALAEVSADHRFHRPTVTADRGISIVAGRHPVVESTMPGQFVPNDAVMADDSQFLLITGPNMAGKSTYMRQVALIVLLAHVGCFVPAEAATIGLVDRIFTRIGASDDLGAGQSTFMVEMVELAQILRQATPRSLVLLDEIGRGTSTYDGLSIAEAVMEALQTAGHNPLTLFATHYHELVEAAALLPQVRNCSMAVREQGADITFLHSVVARPADRSYGIHVGRLAGLPAAVIRRAHSLLQLRESATHGGGWREVAAAASDSREHADEHANQINSIPLLAELAAVDVLSVTPLQAIDLLDKFSRRAKEAMQWVSFK